VMTMPGKTTPVVKGNRGRTIVVVSGIKGSYGRSELPTERTPPRSAAFPP
jgi:hypothetical protein